jgi:hypothetical protein
MENFNYNNVETMKVGGKKTIRKVLIKNGKGVKMVSKYHKGKHLGTAKKPIHEDHIIMISSGKFIKGLFNDCKCETNTNKKTRKNGRK